ncbi:hypothetical protein PBAL39_17354 [Pedobacter sp. BAL39]|uniref:hypothetical protein n=1 Tax=Pedobacter sp. BAL39 TaxID=391596 RepID=UPI000155A6C4|nr:hypothetical protein [Pedobacter sp. BAL39]EDM34224.1 hypothetical protein PBAL39_17354 [Pedobacter sp. BAL39]
MTFYTTYKTWACLLLFSFAGSLTTGAQSRFPTLEVNTAISVTVDETDKGIVAKLTGNKTSFLKKWKRKLSFFETYDIDNDGHMDLVLNSEEHRSNHALIFLFDLESLSYKELSYPYHEFSNLIIDDKVPGVFYSYINGQEWLKFTFKNQWEIYCSAESRVLNDDELSIYLYQTRMYHLDGSIKSTKLEAFEEGNVPLLQVQVPRLRLYEQPKFRPAPAAYLEKGSKFQITALEGKEWLRIRYKNNNGEAEHFVNVSELKVDISGLTHVEAKEGLNMVMINPQNKGDEHFYFSIAMNNYSDKVFESYNGKIYLLLEDEQGSKLLYLLYRTESLKLQPQKQKNTYRSDGHETSFKPGAVLDDNAVQWDAEKAQFVIYHNDNEEEEEVSDYPYLPFFPEGLPAGKYKMSAVFIDGELSMPPVVSNPQELKFPLTKISIEVRN